MGRSRPSDSHDYYHEEELLLQRYATVSNSKSRFHRLAARKTAHKDRIVTISVIILQTITGALTLSNDVPTWAQPIISGLQLALGITVAVQSYLKLQQRSESHRQSSISYGSIHHKLLALLARRPTERPPAPGVVDTYLSTLLELDKNSPMLPLGLCEKVTRKEGLRSNAASANYLPEEVASINTVVEIFPHDPVVLPAQRIPPATPTAETVSNSSSPPPSDKDEFHEA